MKASKFITSIIVTIILTLSSVYVYNTQTTVMSRSQAVQIMSEYGSVNIEDGVIVYIHDYTDVGYDTQLLQAMALMSEEYMLYASHTRK